MICIRCGHRLKRAAAYQPAVTTGPTPHPPGPMGPSCARKAGLLPASLFTRTRVAARRPRARGDVGQMEIAA